MLRLIPKIPSAVMASAFVLFGSHAVAATEGVDAPITYGQSVSYESSSAETSKPAGVSAADSQSNQSQSSASLVSTSSDDGANDGPEEGAEGVSEDKPDAEAIASFIRLLTPSDVEYLYSVYVDGGRSVSSDAVQEKCESLRGCVFSSKENIRVEIPHSDGGSRILFVYL